MELTEREILEGNKVIAEFDGWVYFNDAVGDYPDGYYIKKNGVQFSLPILIDELQYHTSFDWLMPVWAKCYQHLETNNLTLRGEIPYLIDAIEIAFTKSNITLAFTNLVELIKLITNKTE